MFIDEYSNASPAGRSRFAERTTSNSSSFRPSAFGSPLAARL